MDETTYRLVHTRGFEIIPISLLHGRWPPRSDLLCNPKTVVLSNDRTALIVPESEIDDAEDGGVYSCRQCERNNRNGREAGSGKSERQVYRKS
jgi:hypothetical protein